MGQDNPANPYHIEGFSDHLPPRDSPDTSDSDKTSSRRTRSLSFHEAQLQSKTFLISDVEKTKTQLLFQEDTNRDYQITIEDKGPKDMLLGKLSISIIITLHISIIISITITIIIIYL
jgi:hypothetical protein